MSTATDDIGLALSQIVYPPHALPAEPCFDALGGRTINLDALPQVVRTDDIEGLRLRQRQRVGALIRKQLPLNVVALELLADGPVSDEALAAWLERQRPEPQQGDLTEADAVQLLHLIQNP